MIQKLTCSLWKSGYMFQVKLPVQTAITSAHASKARKQTLSCLVPIKFIYFITSMPLTLSLQLNLQAVVPCGYKSLNEPLMCNYSNENFEAVLTCCAL